MAVIANDLRPVALAGLMAAISPTNSPRSVSLWLKLVNTVVSAQAPGAMDVYREPKDPEVRAHLVRAWVRACRPWALLSRADHRAASSAQGNSNRWGPVFWQALHNLSALFSLGQLRLHLLEIFKLLPYVLPCRVCRLHAQDNLVRMRNVLVRANSRAGFVNAVVELHNYITRHLKPAKVALMYPIPFAEPTGRLRVTLRVALDAVADHSHSSIPEAVGKQDCGCKVKA